MATTTFDKNITLGSDAAQRLADALNEPNKLDLPDKSEYFKESDEKWKQFVSNYGKSSKMSNSAQ